MNVVHIVGNSAAAPEIRYTAGGVKVASLRVATNKHFKNKETGAKETRTEWHQVTVFGQLADVAEKYVTAGKQVRISGELRTEKYQKPGDPEGEHRYSTKIICQELELLGGGNKDEEAAPTVGDPSEIPY